MNKIIINCEVSEVMFNSIRELFPDIDLTSNGNLPIHIDCENAETSHTNDVARLSVIALAKFSKTQKLQKHVCNNNNDSGE